MLFNIPLILLAASATTASQIKTNPQTPLIQPLIEDFAETVRKALNKSSIIPEVIYDFTPTCFITAYYSKDSSDKSQSGIVDLGNKFTTKDTKQRPGLSISCPDTEKTSGLVVALTDPDAKSRNDPKWAEICHWIFIIPTGFHSSSNLPLDFTIPNSYVSGSDLVEYKPPGPPPKTGYHRYVFVILEGDTTNLTAPSERQHWGTGKVRHGVRDWAGTEGLKVVGANWFIEEDEEQ